MLPESLRVALDAHSSWQSGNLERREDTGAVDIEKYRTNQKLEAFRRPVRNLKVSYASPSSL